MLYKWFDCFCADQWPSKMINASTIPDYSVVNQDPSTKSGIHWIAVYKNGNDIYFFDSFSRHINDLVESSVDFLRKQGYNVIDADMHLKTNKQHTDDDNCGQRSLAFLNLIKEKVSKKHENCSKKKNDKTKK